MAEAVLLSNPHLTDRAPREVHVYLPAQEELGGHLQCLEMTLNSFVTREFPLLHDSEPVVYSIPSHYIPTIKLQASEAERIVFDQLRSLHSPGLGVLFFHGRHYAGRTSKHCSGPNLITREHDYVVMARFNGKYYTLLMEVKSTSDRQMEMVKTSNAREIKDQKRSALNQLRRHREVLAQQLNIEEESLPGFIMWPFLCGRSVDLRTSQSSRRWQSEDFHLFCDTLASPERFQAWFIQRLTTTPDLPLHDWNKLLHRFLLLSCGASVRELGEELDGAMQRDIERTVALLSVGQHQLLHMAPHPFVSQKIQPLVIQGAAGTGKTLIIVKKLEMLYNRGEIGPDNRALYLCYWPGIRTDVVRRLRRLGVEHVVTQRLSISDDWFIRWCSRQEAGFRHVFVDEMESVLISPFSGQIVEELCRLYMRGNRLTGGDQQQQDQLAQPDPCCPSCLALKQSRAGCAPQLGHFWVSVDENQRTVPAVFHNVSLSLQPHFRLRNVYRSTRNVFTLFRRFCDCADDLRVAHSVNGPPVFWADLTAFDGDCTAAVAALIVDLTGAKGFLPNDICVMPFFDDNSGVEVGALNARLAASYQPGSLVPHAVRGVEALLEATDRRLFCVTWLLRMKGLQCPVVVLVLPADDLDVSDVLDRRKLYTMMSRCTCLLLLLTQPEVVAQLDPAGGLIKRYSFSDVSRDTAS